MTRPHQNLKKATLVALTLPLCLALAAAAASAQKRQAVVVMRAQGGGASVAQCDGTAELNYQIVWEAKLHNKEEVRMADALAGRGASGLVSRKDYEDTRKAKLRDLFALRWGVDGVLYAVSVEGQTPVAVLPDDAKPQKNADQPVSSFYSVMLTGEAREGKQKRQVSLPLRDVHKIYFAAEGAAVNDTLFRHAAEEKSVVLWEAYLRRTNNYRQADANTYMREALIGCARADLDSFAQGDYAALDRARQRAERAHSVHSDAVTQQLVAGITQSRQRVDGVRSQVEGFVTARKYDEAIEAAEPIKIYLSSWPALKDMYREALERSHELHLYKGEEALRASQIDAALSECSTAWKRLPGSAAARDCVCKSRDRVSLRDGQTFRQQRRPKEAKEALEQRLADADCPRDAEVAKKLGESKCEYAQQLLAESRRLVGAGGAPAVVRTAAAQPARRRGRGPVAVPPSNGGAPPRVAAPPSAAVKTISAQNKKDFRDARERLMLAADMCQDEGVNLLLTSVNRSLSGYCLAEAQKAAQRGDSGTAYVYLQTAQGYTPDDAQVLGLLAQARSDFEQRTRVSVGVVFGAAGQWQQVVGEIASEIESAAASAGLAQPVILDRRQAAESLRAIQSGRPLNTPTVIFFGDLVRLHVDRADSPRQVRSSFQYENPYWKEADRVHDARNEDLKRCRKQAGADCSYLDAEVGRLRANRDRHQRNVTEYYHYNENHIKVTGDLRLSFRATDSVSRSTRTAETLEDEVKRDCVARDGVRREDYSARDNPCSEIGDEQSYLRQMLDTVKAGAQRRAQAHLSDLPLSYFTRARSSANRQQAAEDYLRFLFLTRNKTSGEALEAQRALLDFDPELKTDGVLR